MAKIKKSEQYNIIIQLMLQEKSNEEIAERTGYAISTVKNIITKLREEYQVSSKTGIAIAFLREQINNLAKIINGEKLK